MMAAPSLLLLGLALVVTPAVAAEEPLPSFSCAPDEHLLNGWCFWADGASAYNWTLALDACRGRGMAVASVHSAEENSFIHDLIQGGASPWIGLTDLDIEGNFVWSDNTPVDYTNWASDQPGPEFLADTADCVIISSYDGEWYDGDCPATCGVVCKAPAAVKPPSSCAPDEHLFNGACFWADGASAYNWTLAVEACGGRGMAVASVHSAEENKFIFDLTKGGASPWIGLTDLAREGDFVWSDNTPVDYLNWDLSQPGPDFLADTQDCVIISTYDGEWITGDCPATCGVVCRREE